MLTKAVQTVMPAAGSSNEDGSKEPAVTPQWQEGVIPESMTPTASIGADLTGLQLSSKYRDLEEGYRTVKRVKYLLLIADLSRSERDLTEQVAKLKKANEPLLEQVSDHDFKIVEIRNLLNQISRELTALSVAARK